MNMGGGEEFPPLSFVHILFIIKSTYFSQKASISCFLNRVHCIMRIAVTFVYALRISCHIKINIQIMEGL